MNKLGLQESKSEKGEDGYRKKQLRVADSTITII